MSDQGPDFQLPKNIDRLLATLSKTYEREEEWELQNIIVNSTVQVDAGWSYDGSHGHAISFFLPEQLYHFGLREKASIEEKIKDHLNHLQRFPNEHVWQVTVGIDISADGDWRENSGMLVTAKRTVPPSAEKRIWVGENTFRVFLSHISEFKSHTAVVKDRLRVFGISSFVAHEDIEPELKWQNEIELALASMHAFVALVTPGFHESKWTDQEVGFAFARRVPLIAVRLGTDPNGFIADRQAMTSTWATCATDIVKRLIKHDKMLTAYIHALHECPHYMVGNVLAEVLPAITVITNEQIDTLVNVCNRNFALRVSYGFDGSHPNNFGPGVLAHLNRLGPRQFRRIAGLIEEIS
jgi:hypothetical protein